MENEQILLQLRSGQQKEAIAELYKAFPSVRHFIRTHGGNDDEAKDIFQESLIIFYKNAMKPEFKLTATVSTYLFSVSKYLWKDELKKKNRIVHFEVERPEEIFHSSYSEEQFGWMDKIIRSLGEKCMEILELFYYKKQSMEDIAQQLGYKNVDTAKTQKYKCMERAKNMAKEIQVESLKNEL